MIRRLGRPTIRLRLTLLYGAIFFLAGGLLLVVNYTLLRESLSPNPGQVTPPIIRGVEVRLPTGQVREGSVPFPLNAPFMSDGRSLNQVFADIQSATRGDALNTLLRQSSLALGATGIVALGFGWLVAGRALRPVQHITRIAQDASESNLHERINLEGPQDELKELADTLDHMLDRLEVAFESHRQFAAQASHELRTPVAIIRAEADVSLANADTTERERQLAEAVSAAAVRSERIIESLLALARSQSTMHERAEVDFAELVGDVTGEYAPVADTAGIEIELSLGTAIVTGDRELLERLVANLIDNAIRYNLPAGWVEVTIDTRHDAVELRVANSGAILNPIDVDTLFEAFHRQVGDQCGEPSGFGLGLTIARSVVIAHGGTIKATPVPDGGLDIIVTLKSAASA